MDVNLPAEAKPERRTGLRILLLAATWLAVPIYFVALTGQPEAANFVFLMPLAFEMLLAKRLQMEFHWLVFTLVWVVYAALSGAVLFVPKLRTAGVCLVLLVALICLNLMSCRYAGEQFGNAHDKPPPRIYP